MSRPLGVPEVEELIGAYALDAVDPDERAAVEAHLAECPRCRAELAEHLEAASYLSYTGATAPEALWGRIAAALEEPPPAMRLQVVDGSPPRSARFRPGRPLAWTLGAAAAVIVVLLGVGLIRQTNQVSHLRRNLAQSALTRSANQALGDPASTRMTLISPSGRQVTATAVISPSGTGYLMADDLPKLTTDRTYQLWGESGGKLISLGLLGPSPQLTAFPAHGNLKGLAVTDEAAGGVIATKNAPVVATRSI